MRGHDHDHVVADAHAKRAEIDAASGDRHALAARVEEQRQAAAALLDKSRDAVRRNHFSEAIIESMRRRP